MAAADPRVKFAVRYPAGGGKWRYESVDIPHQAADVFPPMEHPPAVGDLISLWDRDETGPRGIFRVLERMWMHASYGSADFPYRAEAPLCGPLLDIICEPADGPYRDEAPMCGHDGCWARLLHGEWVPRPGYDEDDLEAHEHYGQAWPSAPGVEVRYVIEMRRGAGELRRPWTLVWSALADDEQAGGVTGDYARDVLKGFADGTPASEWRLSRRTIVAADEPLDTDG